MELGLENLRCQGSCRDGPPCGARERRSATLAPHETDRTTWLLHHVAGRAVAESNRRENDLHRASETIAFEIRPPPLLRREVTLNCRLPHLGLGVGNSATARGAAWAR